MIAPATPIACYTGPVSDASCCPHPYPHPHPNPNPNAARGAGLGLHAVSPDICRHAILHGYVCRSPAPAPPCPPRDGDGDGDNVTHKQPPKQPPAPEVKALKPYTEIVDMWSLGAILYQLYVRTLVGWPVRPAYGP
jgi:hypothetical protein